MLMVKGSRKTPRRKGGPLASPRDVSVCRLALTLGCLQRLDADPFGIEIASAPQTGSPGPDYDDFSALRDYLLTVIDAEGGAQVFACAIRLCRQRPKMQSVFLTRSELPIIPVREHKTTDRRERRPEHRGLQRPIARAYFPRQPSVPRCPLRYCVRRMRCALHDRVRVRLRSERSTRFPCWGSTRTVECPRGVGIGVGGDLIPPQSENLSLQIVD